MTTTPAQHPPGSSLHLGGDAWANPELAPHLVDLDTLTPYPGNPRRGDQPAITSSIRDHGLYAGVLYQTSTRHILVGNHRRHAVLELGGTRIPATPHDCDDTTAAAIVARDNHTSDLGSYDEAELLALLTRPEVLPRSGYDSEDVAALRRIVEPQVTGPAYTKKADPIHYEPTSEEPPLAESLVNRDRAEQLIKDIQAADLPDAVREFLTLGAYRHLVFDYAQVAEFYTHASPEVQELMEASALVIIDYEDAIRHGYVRLSERLRELLDVDLEYRATLDSRSASLRDA